MEKVEFSSGIPSKTNMRWCIGEQYFFEMYVKKTWYNRIKWFLATKLFLPGTYEFFK